MKTALSCRRPCRWPALPRAERQRCPQASETKSFSVFGIGIGIGGPASAATASERRQLDLPRHCGRASGNRLCASTNNPPPTSSWPVRARARATDLGGVPVHCGNRPWPRAACRPRRLRRWPCVCAIRSPLANRPAWARSCPVVPAGPARLDSARGSGTGEWIMLSGAAASICSCAGNLRAIPTDWAAMPMRPATAARAQCPRTRPPFTLARTPPRSPVRRRCTS